MNKEITNQIHPTARISGNVVLGKYNIIGANVVIEGFKNTSGKVVIGDCNIINEGTRILAGAEGISIGDWNVFHNNMLLMGDNKMDIGHNCWFGQNTILDSSGGLTIGNGVRVGMYSQIWTHVASGELIEGCTLFGTRETIINDDVWLVGSCVVSSGVTLGRKSIYLIGSNVTKSTEEDKVYAGNPAKIMEKLNFYKPISIDEKYLMMLKWSKDFVVINDGYVVSEMDDSFEIVDNKSDYKIRVEKNSEFSYSDLVTVYDLSRKVYNKTLSELERKFYKYIYNHKARFLHLK